MGLRPRMAVAVASVLLHGGLAVARPFLGLATARRGQLAADWVFGPSCGAPLPPPLTLGAVAPNHGHLIH